MNPRPLIAGAILASVLFVSPGTGETWFWVPEPGDPNPLGLTVDYPQEDDPRWDCRTMGNRVCGPAIMPDGIESDTGEHVAGYN